MASSYDVTKSGAKWSKINLEDYKEGTKVSFYKPPSALEAEKKGRKAKHMDHYVGPATILKKVGTRSFLIEYKNSDGKIRTFQRDASMLSLLPPAEVDFEPNTSEINVFAPQKHRSITANPLREGEIVILKDGSEAKDWYCAQLVKVLPTHVLVHYYTTASAPLEDYYKASSAERRNNISRALFLKTWCLNGGKGPATTTPPEGIREVRDIWPGKIEVSDLQKCLLIRNVGMNASGNLSNETAEIASKLKYPHHQGA